jgi:hypothetical protein
MGIFKLLLNINCPEICDAIKYSNKLPQISTAHLVKYTHSLRSTHRSSAQPALCGELQQDDSLISRALHGSFGNRKCEALSSSWNKREASLGENCPKSKESSVRPQLIRTTT